MDIRNELVLDESCRTSKDAELSSVWAWETKQSNIKFALTNTEMHSPERIYLLKEDNKINNMEVTTVEKKLV